MLKSHFLYLCLVGFAIFHKPHISGTLTFFRQTNQEKIKFERDLSQSQLHTLVSSGNTNEHCLDNFNLIHVKK